MLQLFENILVIAAHPDDEVLGVGGTIPKLVKMGKKVDVLVFTDGSSTQYSNDNAILESKFGEAKRANDILGTTLLPREDFPDMRLDTVAHADKNIALGNIISKGGYDTVFVQDRTDINKDHNELFESTLVSCRPYPGQKVKHLLSYYVNSSTEWGNMLKKKPFNPNIFIDISDTIEDKLNAMAEYKTELRDYPHPRSLDGIRNSAKYFGNMVGMQYAEPFHLVFSK
ncbi:PIG-L deacetylase family protein [Flagellimonas flava]|uniref:N-acetylglucosaminyl deacetylase, LmbE family n=1 Tax=Flagellimonas flava TaxID=570519 RepID=A0A1M5J612_9FLAO|nr:PIG-L deacetylase family protein [Allomuricauda flava]SHG36056.1 N-acetylglucosaminyl deacetylase, LmbE family [Allomuricauda flava]